MDTGVNIQVVTSRPRGVVERDVQRALAWFETVERVCTRFDPNSEVMQLLDRVGEPVTVSTLLFEAVAFALDLADQTSGAFDPTIGAHMEQLGFNINYRTGEVIQTPVDARSGSYRDVVLDRGRRTILLQRPLVLDLNAVAKGLAIDLAVRELGDYQSVCVEAGGDVYVAGHNLAGQAWRVGIQHPRADGLMLETLELSDTAVCSSGDYERRGHIVDARSRGSLRQPRAAGHEQHPKRARAQKPSPSTARSELASVTVLAPTAMAADGLSTAAMVLGYDRGIQLLERQGVRGLLVAPDGRVWKVNL
jgi:thiamine biosynthesis lipoprotein